MATATRKCKVCGKEYEYCHTFRRDGNIFRWQDVACCPEHGSIYFERVMAARAKNRKSDEDVKTEHSECECVESIDENDDEYDELFEEGFDYSDNDEEDI